MGLIMLKYEGYSVLYNFKLHRLTCKMPHVQENNHFFLIINFHMVFEEQIAK